MLFEMFRSLAFETVARFVTPGYASGPTSTVSVMVLEPPGFTGLEFVQITAGSIVAQVQPLPLTEATANPCGSASVTVITPEVVVMPTLVIITVYTPSPPTLKLPERLIAIMRSGEPGVTA